MVMLVGVGAVLAVVVVKWGECGELMATFIFILTPSKLIRSSLFLESFFLFLFFRFAVERERRGEKIDKDGSTSTAISSLAREADRTRLRTPISSTFTCGQSFSNQRTAYLPDL